MITIESPEWIRGEDDIVYIRADLVSGAIITAIDNQGNPRGRVMGPSDLRELGE